MNLVPTLEKMVGEIVARDFWSNHFAEQGNLDRQNEGELSFPARMSAIWDLLSSHDPLWSTLKRTVKT